MAEEITVASTVKNEHHEAAQKVLDAAHEYWRWRQQNGLTGAVVWIRDDADRLLVFTRGEYAEVIHETIERQSRGAPRPSWGVEGGA